MNTDDIIKHMKEAHERLQKNELNKLPDGYICVIHPSHRRWLEQITEPTIHNNWVGSMMGLPIYEENRAPLDKFEFMDLITYHMKYPPIFPKQYSRREIALGNIRMYARRYYMIIKSKLRRSR